MAKKARKYPPLTKAQQQLVKEHKWVAGRLAYGAVSSTGNHTGSLTKEDLESVANFALCVAAAKYDGSKGIMFSTYAWKTAKGYIQHALRDHSRLVKTPRWIVNYQNQVKVAIQDKKSYKTIAEELGITESKVLMTEMSSMNFHVSYDSSPEDWVSREFIYNDDDVKPYVVSEELISEMKNLSESEMSIMLKFIDESPQSKEDKEWAEQKLSSLRNVAHGQG
jgi:DNA-directed RNA polymerase specialized sigma subunit